MLKHEEQEVQGTRAGQRQAKMNSKSFIALLLLAVFVGGEIAYAAELQE